LRSPWCRHTAPRTHGRWRGGPGSSGHRAGFRRVRRLDVSDRSRRLRQASGRGFARGGLRRARRAGRCDRRSADGPGVRRDRRGVGQPVYAGQQREDHHDQRPRATSVRDFQRVLQLRWWTFTQLEGGTAQRRRHHRKPGTPSCCPASTRRPATPAGRRGRRRSTDPEPSPQQRTTWTSAHDAKTSSTAPDRMSSSGAIPRPARCRDDEPLAASGCPTRAAPHPYGGAAVRRSSVSAYHGE